MIKIDKHIPLPRIVGTGRGSKYPWELMKVGDSFLASLKVTSVAPSASRYGQRLKRKFVLRTVGKNKARVWRVK